MSSSVITTSADEQFQLLKPRERAVDIYCWRVEVLEQVGYTGAFAHMLAENTAIDLHQACQLKTRGCTDTTAYAILFLSRQPPAGTSLESTSLVGRSAPGDHAGARRRY
jgi:hypothetical protein